MEVANRLNDEEAGRHGVHSTLPVLVGRIVSWGLPEGHTMVLILVGLMDATDIVELKVTHLLKL
jgi:hypothetical protein